MRKPSKPEKAGTLYAKEAEQGIIGAVVTHPQLIIESDRLNDALFGIVAYREIFRAIAECLEDSGTADFVAICTKLRDKGKLDDLAAEVGGVKCIGAGLISQLATFNAAAHIHLTDWVKTCEEAASRRSIVADCEKGIKDVYEGEAPAEIVGRLQSSLGLVVERKTRDDKTTYLLDQADKRLGDRLSGNVQLGLPTGIPPWDKAMGGILAGDMFLLGARPKVGKTACIETAIQMQIECGKHVVCFQQDMSPVMMIERIACRMAEVCYEIYAMGRAHSGDVYKVKEKLRLLRKMSKRLHIYSESKLTANTLCAIVRRLALQYPIACWYLDHFQQLRYEERDRTEGLTNSSMTLRDFITATQIPGVIVAQLNKEAQDSRPNAGQFKYCDQLFSDADRVVLLWSKDDARDLKPNQRQEVIWTIDANRGGGVSDERMHFHRELMTFEQI